MLQSVEKSLVASQPFEIELLVDLCEILIFLRDLHRSKAPCEGGFPGPRIRRIDRFGHFGGSGGLMKPKLLDLERSEVSFGTQMIFGRLFVGF